MPRPHWNNEHKFIVRAKYPSIVDITAMINYCLVSEGIPSSMSWRTYEIWEDRKYPLWFRCGMKWMFPMIRDLTFDADEYEILRTDDHELTPTLRPKLTLEQRWQQIKLDPECCKQ